MIAGFTNCEIDAFEGRPFGQIFGSVYQRANAGNDNIKTIPSGELLINDDKNSPGFGMPIVAAKNAIIGDVNPDWKG